MATNVSIHTTFEPMPENPVDPKLLSYDELRKMANLEAQKMQNTYFPISSITGTKTKIIDPPLRPGLSGLSRLPAQGLIAQDYQDVQGQVISIGGQSANILRWNLVHDVDRKEFDPIEKEAKKIFDDLKYSITSGVDSSRLKKFLRSTKHRAEAMV